MGFASCGPARHRLEGLEAEIYALYVLQAQQRRGVGRALVRACARHFVRHGCFGFYLWVLKANRARLFYESRSAAEEVGAKTERLGLPFVRRDRLRLARPDRPRRAADVAARSRQRDRLK